MTKVPALLSLTAVAAAIAFPLAARADSSLLNQPWNLSGGPGGVEKYQSVSSNILSGKSVLRLDYNLHGTCLIGGDASAVIFDQNGWKYISLSNYGQNCKDGDQSVNIPLTDFQALDTSRPLTGQFHVRFWQSKSFTIDIKSATLLDTTGSASTPNQSGSFSGISDSQTVSGKIYVQYLADAASTRQVDWYIDDNKSETDTSSPYWLGGDLNGQPRGWNTAWIPAISHELKVVVTKNDGSTYSNKLNFTVSRSTATASTPTATPRPTAAPNVVSTPTPTGVNPVQSSTWSIQSIDSMKDTKDAVCGQRDDAYISAWLDKARDIGANYVAISMPYDNPSCASSVSYAKRWIKAIRSKGLHVWHRRMPMAFEGIYDTPKTGGDYLSQIANYVRSNQDEYQAGDIFTPIPEPQNGGISGFSSCGSYCQYSSIADFNRWLRDAITRSRQAFTDIGLPDMKIGYYGFDGFVAWGDNNPDWEGILENATVEAMGNIITIDHYPEAIGGNMDTDLSELEAKYPNAKIVIGEWGTITGGNTEQQVINSLGAAKKHSSVIGINYWHFGPGGTGEQLINQSNGQFTNNPQYDEVQSFYLGKR